jgi:alcohol dehydrogenase (cytochrome c)
VDRSPHAIALVLWLALGVPATALAQSAEEIERDQATPADILTYGMGHGLQRFSPLAQINTDTIADLVPAWSFGLGGDMGQEAQPLLYKGVLYLTTPDATFAVDARTGRRQWTHRITYPKEVFGTLCCGIVNRGAALYEGRLYRQTLDNHVLALDLATGEEAWRVKVEESKRGYSMTGAPLVANGVVITGVAGAEFGVRCFLDGWDAATGRKLWRFKTIPDAGEPGAETWSGEGYKQGGGSTWLTGSYDPALDLVYWGTGNPSPWTAAKRHGDNLYTNSVIALRPRTGERVWHYQFTPNDTYDYDGTNELIHATLTLDGRARKVIMQANRNGYFYVIDRATGELLRADAFVDRITWAEGIDMKTGRPIVSKATLRNLQVGVQAEVWPSALGGKNWSPSSFHPGTGLVYLNAHEVSMTYKPVEMEWVEGAPYFGAEFAFVMPDKPIGRLRAIDPASGRRAWEVPLDPPPMGGTLATAGNLVFTGLHTGELLAFDARDGRELWRYQTGSGVIAPPVTYEVDGIQYVAVLSGLGGLLAKYLPHPDIHATNTGGLLTVFRLHPLPQRPAQQH